jgi:hypothetical protein
MKELLQAKVRSVYCLGDFKVDAEHRDQLDALIARFRSQKVRVKKLVVRTSIRTSAVPVRKPSRTPDTRCPLPDPCDGKNVARRVAIEDRRKGGVTPTTPGSLRQLEQTVASSGSSSAQGGQTFTPKSFRRPAAVAVALGACAPLRPISCRIIVPPLPDLDRADRIGEFWGYPGSRAFAELLIDSEEDRTPQGRALPIAREANR